MKIKAKFEMALCITTHMIDEDTPNQESFVLKKDEIIDIDVIHENETHYEEVQFGDGSVAFQLKKEDFSIIS